MRKQENYLDYIPKRNSRYSYQLNEHGNVEIIVKNEVFWNRILQIKLCMAGNGREKNSI